MAGRHCARQSQVSSSRFRFQKMQRPAARMFSWELSRPRFDSANGDRPFVGTRRANGASVFRMNESS